MSLNRIVIIEAVRIAGVYQDRCGSFTYDFPAGSVLDVRHWTAHVHSDNAMIDSGEMVSVEWWNENASRVETITVNQGRPGDFFVVPPVDANTDVKAQAQAYREVRHWAETQIHKCREVEHAAKQPARGDQVEVFKGRKCPKGIYTISGILNGDWGPAFHLYGADGLPHTYIAQGNCKLLKKVSYKGIDFAEFFAECSNYNYTTMGVLADYLQECGDERGRYLFAYYDLLTAKKEYEYA